MNLPAPIAAYVAAQNAHDAPALAALFTEDALVHDEAADRRGRAAIQAWMEHAIASYAMTLAPQHFDQRPDGGVLTGAVSGTFPGSPITLRHDFTLMQNKIATLSITPGSSS